jgi:hypothetical protein
MIIDVNQLVGYVVESEALDTGGVLEREGTARKLACHTAGGENRKKAVPGHSVPKCRRHCGRWASIIAL